MRKFSWIAALTVIVASTAVAQGASIDPGMSKEQVIAKLGRPISEHSSGPRTYLYYSNGDEKKYGMHDFVVIEDGKVVDAVFRSSAHRYSGRSSSPAAVTADEAIAKGHGGHMPPRHEPVERKPEPPMEKKAPAPMISKKPEPPRKAEPAAKKGEPQTKKAEPPATKRPEPPAVKKAEPPAKTATPTRKAEPPAKAVPPATRPHEPLKGTDTKKIAPNAKAPDTTKKAHSAPTKKP